MDDEKLMRAIGIRIKEERQRLRLTQQAVAERTQVTKLTQIKYEAGKTVPNASYLALFADRGADVLYILTGQHTPEVREIAKEAVALQEDEAALLDYYRSATPAGRAAIRQVGAAFTEAVGKLG